MGHCADERIGHNPPKCDLLESKAVLRLVGRYKQIVSPLGIAERAAIVASGRDYDRRAGSEYAPA